MNNLQKNYHSFINFLKKGDALILLVIRCTLAYGFYEPAMNKIKNIGDIASWFEGMGIPLPHLNAYLSAYTEFLGVWLLLIGYGVRIISIPLVIVMLVAIKTVHWENGFAAGDNGFEIPFYYMLMLLTLLIFGGGNYSLDNAISCFRRKKKNA